MSRGLVHSALVSCAAVGLLGASTAAALADPVVDFYKGKQISLIIGSGEGGGYDISGRLTAEFLSKYIPGHPLIIARNMPGASGMRAADYMYNVAAQDGTVISIPQPTLLLNKVVDASARYEPQGFSWVGRLGALQTFGVAWHAAPVQSIEQAKQKEIVMAAAQGPGTGSNVVMALNALVGTRLTLVKGYKSVSESALAMERGEVQGISSTSWEFLESKGWISGRLVTPLYVIGMVRSAKVPQTLTIGEFASNDGDRDVLNAISSASDIGRSILLPPNVPAERVAALRKAFDELVRDPDFIRESERRNVALEPLGGDQLQAMVDKAMTLTPEVVERIRHTIRQ